MVIEIILSVIVVEVLFRITYYAINKKNYHVSLKLKWKDSYVVPHPFLSFSYKKNTTINKNQKLPYPIHTNKFFSFKEPLKRLYTDLIPQEIIDRKKIGFPVPLESVFSNKVDSKTTPMDAWLEYNINLIKH